MIRTPEFEHQPTHVCPQCAEEDATGNLVCLHSWFRTDIYGYKAQRAVRP